MSPSTSPPPATVSTTSTLATTTNVATALAAAASSTPKANNIIEPLNLKNISNHHIDGTSRTSLQSSTPSVPNTACAQRFLPKQLVMGSPFYHTSESTFSQSPVIVNSKFRSLVNKHIQEEGEEEEEKEKELMRAQNANVNGNDTEDHPRHSVSPCTAPPSQPASSSAHKSSRTVRFTNVHPDTSLAGILNYISLGPVESCHYDDIDETDESDGADTPHNVSVIVSFIEPYTARKCCEQLNEMIEDLRKLLSSPALQVQRISSPALSPMVKKEVTTNGASRALCITQLPSKITQKSLVEELSKFGTISLVQYNSLKNSTFVYFTSILSAIKCLNQLPLMDSHLSDSKVFYSSDGESASVPIFSTSNSFMDTFNDIQDLNSLKRGNANIVYSTTPTSVSSRRDSADFAATATTTGPHAEKASRAMALAESDSRSSGSDVQIITSGKYKYPRDNLITPKVKPTAERFYSNNNMLNNSTPMFYHPSESEYQHAYQNTYTYPQTPNFSMTPTQDYLNNRTVYLGNLHPKSTAEDVCNVVRGGMLESIRMLKSKHAAFVTFIDHYAAADFIARSIDNTIVINNHYINVGWGKNSTELDPAIRDAVQNGASRNMYIGINPSLEDEGDYEVVPFTETEMKRQMKKFRETETDAGTDDVDHTNKSDIDLTKFKMVYHCIPDEETLRRDFSVFGSIEQINFFKNGACAFINFTDIQSCICAVESFNGADAEELAILHKSMNDRYLKLIVNYGKDRCANAPKKRAKATKKGDKSQRYRSDASGHSNVGSGSRSRSRSSVSSIPKYKNRPSLNSSFSYGNPESFSYGLQENYSVDTDLALKFESSFHGMGITSPAAKKKVEQYRGANVEESDDDDSVTSDIGNPLLINNGDVSELLDTENFDTQEDTFDQDDPNYSLSLSNFNSNSAGRTNSIPCDISRPRTGRANWRGSSSRNSSTTSFKFTPNNSFSISNGAYIMTPQHYYYAPQTPTMPYMYPYVPSYVPSVPATYQPGDNYFYQHYPQSQSSGHLGDRSRHASKGNVRGKRK